MVFKCMLSPAEDPLSYPEYFENLRYPLLASAKYDGIRVIPREAIAFSRTNKPIPSTQAQDRFGFEEALEWIDGELIEGNPCDFGVYNRTQSHVMAKNKPGDLSFWAFDYAHPDWLDKPFYQRHDELQRRVNLIQRCDVSVIPHVPIENYKELIEFENVSLAQGFEGIMMRDPLGRYKQGRGTYKEGLIYKLKRFRDDEAVIVSLYEAQTNMNEKVTNEMGRSSRSSHKENLIPAGRVGGFICIFNGEEIDVAPGAFTHSELTSMWRSRNAYEGQLLKFRHMTHGVKDKPRFPRALGLRTVNDL